jgi:drug/metabolite transporter (DMT)-like permease
MPPRPRRRPGAPDLALAGAALCFGGTFLVVQDAIEDVEPIPFLAVRFTLGAIVLWLLARRRPITPGLWRDGALIGLALLAGYVFQTIGLQYTDSATSAFITYLLVVFVPLIGFVAYRRRPHPITLASVVLAMVGLALLTGALGSDGGGIGKGELLTVACALAFGAQVVLLGEMARRHDPLRLAAIQVTVVAVACAGPGAFLGGYHFSGRALVAAAATAVVATAGGFGLQVYGQRSVPPARASLLLLLEPVFAAVLAAATGDPLGATQLLGAGVILTAILVSELSSTSLDQAVGLGEAGPDNDRY